MYFSFFIFSLLIASTMAYPSYFSPYNIPPYKEPSNNYPPYNYPPYNFQTPPPEGSGYTPTPGGYTTTAPPPNDGGYTSNPPPPHKSNSYETPPPAASGDDMNGFLAGQNAARSAITVAKLPELTWNETLAAYALNYANQRKGDCELVHSKGPYGENIAEGSELTAEDAVNLWVSEKSNYDYASNQCTSGECGHYTQVVWKDTTHLGCARVKCDSGGFFATCNYSPQGNYVGERPY